MHARNNQTKGYFHNSFVNNAGIIRPKASYHYVQKRFVKIVDNKERKEWRYLDPKQHKTCCNSRRSYIVE